MCASWYSDKIYLRERVTSQIEIAFLELFNLSSFSFVSGSQ